jgi:hypothetical protein
MYTNGVPKEVNNVINKYEAISESICIHCGSIHAQPVNEYGWWLPVCKECWDKNNIKYSKRGYKTKDYTEVADEAYPELKDYYEYSYYNNGENETVRVDISDTTDKIRKAYDKRMRIRKKKNIESAPVEFGDCGVLKTKGGINQP